jgi:hypothetical protein
MILNTVTTNFKAQPLTDDDLRHEARSIFATGPMSGLSVRYAFVPTTEIVAGLREKNWLPVHVEQQRVRSESRLGFQKHLIRFRRAEQMQTLDEWNPELVLTNSHDAGCAYILQVGIYRRLCSNGLVVSSDSLSAIRFRHAGLQAEAVVQASYRILEYLPKVGALINSFRNHLLSDREALTFAQQSLVLRYGSLEQSPIEAQTLLVPRRAEDQASDLWVSLNRSQEHLVRGGLSDCRRDRGGKLRTVRALRGIDSKIALNMALWSLAEATANSRN